MAIVPRSRRRARGESRGSEPPRTDTAWRQSHGPEDDGLGSPVGKVEAADNGKEQRERAAANRIVEQRGDCPVENPSSQPAANGRKTPALQSAATLPLALLILEQPQLAGGGFTPLSHHQPLDLDRICCRRPRRTCLRRGCEEGLSMESTHQKAADQRVSQELTRDEPVLVDTRVGVATGERTVAKL
ncbi:hypothetical protein G7046_g5722 [Stylonectria norvegica]|nr:hypothetical protein G7046_g5722 [Stylonectria norvegica]